MKYKDLDMVVNFGHWSVTDNAIKVIAVGSGGQHERDSNDIGAIVSYYKPGEKLIDYSVTATKNTSASDVFSLVMRAKGPQDCLQFTRYGQEVSLYLIKDGLFTRIVNQKIGQCKTRETLKGEIVGNEFKGYVDGKLYIEYTFNDGEINSYGHLGLQTNHNHAYFDDYTLNVIKSEKADLSVQDIDFKNLQLSQNQVGRQTLQAEITSKNSNTEVIGVNCKAYAMIPDDAFGGMAWSKRTDITNAQMQAVIEENAKTMGILLRAQKKDGADSYIIFGRYYECMSLFRVADGKTDLLDYTVIPENVIPKEMKVSIKGNKLTGYLNGEEVLKHKFQSGEINKQGAVGLVTDIQNTKVFNVTLDGKPIELVDYMGKWSIKNNRYEMTGIASGGGFERYKILKEEIPVNPFAIQNADKGTYRFQSPFYALYEGPVKINVTAWDSYGRHQSKLLDVDLHAPEQTYNSVDGTKFFDNIEPHALWRAKTTSDTPLNSSVIFPNYVWRVQWNTASISLIPRTITANKDEIGRKIIDGAPITVRPVLTDENGNDISVKFSRYFEGYTSVYGIQPSYKLDSEYGTAIIHVQVFNGDPVIRIHGKFLPKKDCKVSLSYKLSGISEDVKIISPVSKFDIKQYYHIFYQGDDRGPLFAISYNKKPLTDSGLSNLKYAPVSFTKDKQADFPMMAVSLVDGDVDYSKASSQQYISLAQKMAQSSLSVPNINAEMRDIGVSQDGAIFNMEYVRTYRFMENDYGVTDIGQFFAVPWCAQNTLDKTLLDGYGLFHSAYGNRPYVITKESVIKMHMPMPELLSETLAPNYIDLNANWYDKAKKDVLYFMSLQLPDGTYDKYDRMDHYSLGRITLAMMLAYPGFDKDKAVQQKIGQQVKLSLDRMLGLQDFKNLKNSEIQKYYGDLYQYQIFEKGALYQPFSYHPQWDLHTENYGYVDQNLGHVHVFYSMYLYGKYVDPDFLKREDVQKRVKQLIKFEWMNQELNGDIYRVVIGGQNAAGSGDGYEEDLVLMLPELAKLSGIDTQWYNRACRIATMKLGALKYFDYIPLDNEYQMQFCSPIHNMDNWTPEAGWKLDSFGDVWFMAPATAGSVYGKWYYNSVLKGQDAMIDFMQYDKFEEYRDIWGSDLRFWLSTNGQVTEAYRKDPFLGAVKLMMAYDRASKRSGCLDQATNQEQIWNFIFFANQMVLINDELQNRYAFMKDAQPVACGVKVIDFNYGLYYYVYSWKLKGGGAVISSASYHTQKSEKVLATPSAEKLGLSKTGKWEITDINANKTFTVDAGSELTLNLVPRQATTYIIRNAKG